MPDSAARPATDLRRVVTLLLLQTNVSVPLIELLGSAGAAELEARLNALARGVLGRVGGREIEKADRFLFLFERPIDAVRFALAFHAELAALAAEVDLPIAGRVAVHLGEVFLHENLPEHVERGAKAIEVEGAPRSVVSRLLSLACGGQTLLSLAAYELARRAAVGREDLPNDFCWAAHGSYRFAESDEPLEVFEVGDGGSAPFVAPDPESFTRRETKTVRRVDSSEWTPTGGGGIPGRPSWALERRLPDPTYGVLWLGRNRKTGDLHTFRFCAKPSDVERMRRQLEVVRHAREQCPDRSLAGRTLEAQLSEVPFFLESEHLEAMRSWSTWAEDAEGLAATTISERVELVSCVARLCAEAHGAGIAVGNLVPASLMLGDGGDSGPRCLLRDLAGARVVNRSSRATAEEGGGLVAPAASSEPRDHGDPTFSSDVAALGLLLYQLCVGDLRRSPGAFWERDVPDRRLRELIAACLDPDPSVRLAHAGQVCDGLDRLGSGVDPADESAPDESGGPSAPAEEGGIRRLLGRLGARRPG